MNFSPTVFWYSRPGGKSNLKPNPKAASLPVAMKIEDVLEVKRVKNAIEGESMKVGSVSGGKTEIQNNPDFGWSGNQQVWWHGGKIGSSLTLDFEAKTAGRFEIFANLTQAPDYGIVQLDLNERMIVKEVDGFYGGGVKTSRVSLGIQEVKKGRNRLKVTIVGSNPKAAKKFMFGLDYLLIKE